MIYYGCNVHCRNMLCQVLIVTFTIVVYSHCWGHSRPTLQQAREGMYDVILVCTHSRFFCNSSISSTIVVVLGSGMKYVVSQAGRFELL